MRLAFEVEGTGAVSNVEVETSSFAEPSVATCLADRVAGLHFEAPGEKQRTHWTFVSGLYEKSDDDERSTKSKRKKRKERDESTEQGVVIEPKSAARSSPRRSKRSSTPASVCSRTATAKASTGIRGSPAWSACAW